MTEVAIIAIIVILAAIVIGKANHSNDLVWRLLFCFSVSVCVSIGFLYIFSSKPKAKAANVEVISKAGDSTDAHVVCFNQIAMAEVTEQDITGQESLLSECLTWAPVMNVLPLNSLNYIMEHIIIDDS